MTRRLTGYNPAPEFASINTQVRWLVANVPIPDWAARADLVLSCPKCELTVAWRFPEPGCIVAVNDYTDELAAVIKAPKTRTATGAWNTWADIDRVNRSNVRTDEHCFACFPLAALDARGITTRCRCRRMKVPFDTLTRVVAEGGQERLLLSAAT